MTNWRQHQQILIALTFIGVFLTLCRFSLDPTAGKRPVTAFAFPQAVPLPEWQLLESSSSAKPTAKPSNLYEAVLASRKYRYQQNNQQMEIEMRYLAGTLGNLQGYLMDYASIQVQDSQLLQNLRQQQGVGFYSLFVNQGRAHLNACINPRGGSTVTMAQFLANRQAKDLQLQRLIPWLLGEESLRDRRCLWVNLSVPLSQESVETTYPILEKAWASWYQWWSPRFPQH